MLAITPLRLRGFCSHPAKIQPIVGTTNAARFVGYLQGFGGLFDA